MEAATSALGAIILMLAILAIAVLVGIKPETKRGVVKWSLSTDPMAWNLAGEFLFKDIVLFCVCVVLLLASLPQVVTRLRC